MSTSPAPAANTPTILIVGASRGLGLGLVHEYLGRGWKVIATERQFTPALRETGYGDALRIEQIDITESGEIAGLAETLANETLDVLFVNAGIANDRTTKVEEIDDAGFVKVMSTNALAPLRVIAALAPRVKPKGTIVAMSSRLGSVELNTDGDHEVYRASKAALNTLLRSFGRRDNGERTILAMSPGWVRTDMGGDEAPLDIPTSARGMADVVAKRAGKPGVFFVNYLDEEIPW